MLNVVFEKNSKTVVLISSLLNTASFISIYFFFYYSMPIFSLFSLVVIINSILLLVERGILIDEKSNQSMIYKSLFGIKFGKWKKLLNAAYISLFKGLRVQKTSRGRDIDYRYSNVYEVNLFDNNNRSITLFEADIEFLKETKDCAFQISNYLNIPLLDATANDYKWVKKV